MSVTNTKAYVTLVTEHILLILAICCYFFLFLTNVISANVVKVISFVNSAIIIYNFKKKLLRCKYHKKKLKNSKKSEVVCSTF